MSKILIDEAAVKLALEALEHLQPTALTSFYTIGDRNKAITALREALAQQEPVAWMFQHEETGRTMCVDAQQVEWGFEKGNPRLKKIAPLYTSPPAQRKPLTYEQRNTIISQECRYTSEAATEDHHHLIEAVELLHNIKENT